MIRERSDLIWIGIKKKLTYEEVKEIAEKLNIRLPEDYCRKIGAINGGALKNSCYLHPQLGEIPYSRNLNLCQDVKGNALELYEALDGGSRHYFPFGSVGNGDYFCFNLKNQKVVLYVHEEDKSYPVCNTYTELMQGIAEVRESGQESFESVY